MAATAKNSYCIYGFQKTFENSILCKPHNVKPKKIRNVEIGFIYLLLDRHKYGIENI